jgi:hypothetical protein
MQYPGQLEMIKNNPSFLPNAIEELEAISKITFSCYFLFKSLDSKFWVGRTPFGRPQKRLAQPTSPFAIFAFLFLK